jgi:hypothetical protein
MPLALLDTLTPPVPAAERKQWCDRLMADVGASGSVDVLQSCLHMHYAGQLTEDTAQTIVRSADQAAG